MWRLWEAIPPHMGPGAHGAPALWGWRCGAAREGSLHWSWSPDPDPSSEARVLFPLPGACMWSLLRNNLKARAMPPTPRGPWGPIGGRGPMGPHPIWGGISPLGRYMGPQGFLWGGITPKIHHTGPLGPLMGRKCSQKPPHGPFGPFWTEFTPTGATKGTGTKGPRTKD